MNKMSGLIIDASGPRRALLFGQYLGGASLASWASDLVRTALSTVDLEAEVLTSTSSAGADWAVEARVSAHAAVLIDIDINDSAAPGHDSIDRLELRAARTWRGVTRNAAPFELRPWLGAIRISRTNAPAVGVERLTELVASRVLDAACVVAVDAAGDGLWSPSPAMSIESFQAALVGRFLVLTTLQRPA